MVLVQTKKINLGLIVFCIFLSVFVLVLTFTTYATSEPTAVYTVYLDGKSIGSISSKESFNDYVNSKEEELKKKYDVDTVYSPKGVEIKKNITYSPSVSSDVEIYNKIISNKKFTVHGYQITIVNTDDEDNNKKTLNLYVLDKKVFDEAVENTIKAFVDEEQYEKFVAGTQEEVKDLGSMIENIDLLENITYKETLISTDEKIFVDVDELSKYLLYGTLEKKETYTVKAEDTIESIA